MATIRFLTTSAPTWLFYLWNLPFLPLSSLVIWLFVTFAILNYVYRPLRHYKRSRARILTLHK